MHSLASLPRARGSLETSAGGGVKGVVMKFGVVVLVVVRHAGWGARETCSIIMLC